MTVREMVFAFFVVLSTGIVVFASMLFHNPSPGSFKLIIILLIMFGFSVIGQIVGIVVKCPKKVCGEEVLIDLLLVCWFISIILIVLDTLNKVALAWGWSQ
jgi:hypothetical protein